MEYRTPFLAVLGILTTLAWALNYLGYFQTSKLVVGRVNNNGKKAKLYKTSNFVIGLIAWLLISFSMTGPRKPLSFSPSQIEVNDILLVLDVSRSMLAEDLKPNRIENAKQRLREFAALKPTDRIGIIIFSEKVFTLLPLTTDPSLIDKIISDIRIGFLGSGTNIGDALGLAVA